MYIAQKECAVAHQAHRSPLTAHPFNVKCSSLNHYLAIADKDTLLCLLHTTAREVIGSRFSRSVFTFQFVNACLVVGKGNNLAKTAPRLCCLITVN